MEWLLDGTVYFLGGGFLAGVLLAGMTLRRHNRSSSKFLPPSSQNGDSHHGNDVDPLKLS